MNTVLPEKAHLVFYRLHRLPVHGILYKSGVPLVVGAKISQDDINRGRVAYQHTGSFVDGQTEDYDSFDFSLWDPENGTITADMYTDCMPARSIETPSHGVFRFLIHITKPKTPDIINPVTPMKLIEFGTLTLTSQYLNASKENFTPDQIIHTIKTPPHNGFISLRGEQSLAFTQADINEGVVKYVNTRLGEGTDYIGLSSCSMDSVCSDTSLNFEIEPKFKQTGDNILYASTGSMFNWAFSTNMGDAVWELVNGSDQAPTSSMPFFGNILSWSTYSTTSDIPDGTEDRGPGYVNLPEYRNVRERLYWNGGLPVGVYFSNAGILSSARRIPDSLAGSQPWRLPNTPQSFYFTLKATNPKTGQNDIRKYVLVVTNTGLSDTGLESESRNL